MTNEELEAIRARDAKGLVSGAVEQIGDAVSASVDRRTLLAEVDRLRRGHCKDCCCARAWEALGITQYTGRSIPEEIERLREWQRRIVVAANTVDYCYGRRPENFAAALRDLNALIEEARHE